MRKFTKVMLVFACIFLAVGIGFSVAGAAMGASMEEMDFSEDFKHGAGKMWNMVFEDNDWDFDWDDDDDGSYTEANWTQKDGDVRSYPVGSVEELEIDLHYDELILMTHSGENVLVEVENDDSQNVTVETSSNKLKIKSKKRKSNRCVTVSYPVGKKFSKVKINVGAGSVEVEDALYADELEVEIGAGEFVNEDSITVRSLDVEVGTGNAELTDVTTDKIDGECGIGSLYMSVLGQETDYNYKLECGIGDISIGGESYSGFAKEKKINNPGATGEIDLECGIGSIELTFE